MSEATMESRAVVANGPAHGALLWWWGRSIDHAVDGLSATLDDLGLDDAPRGISVWEGHFITREIHYIDGAEYEMDPIGAFRAPTDSEWETIRRGVSPWADDAQWWQVEPEEG